MSFVNGAANIVSTTGSRTSSKRLTSEFWRGASMLVHVNGAWSGLQFFGGHGGVEFQVEKSYHHFVPTLLAPDHTFGGIGVFGIAGGIIEVGGAFDFCAL